MHKTKETGENTNNFSAYLKHSIFVGNDPFKRKSMIKFTELQIPSVFQLLSISLSKLSLPLSPSGKVNFVLLGFHLRAHQHHLFSTPRHCNGGVLFCSDIVPAEPSHLLIRNLNRFAAFSKAPVLDPFVVKTFHFTLSAMMRYNRPTKAVNISFTALLVAFFSTKSCLLRPMRCI